MTRLTSIIPVYMGETYQFASAVPNAEKILGFRVIAVCCQDAELLVQARLTNIELHVAKTRLMKQLKPRATQVFRPHWSHLLVDEVGSFRPSNAWSLLTRYAILTGRPSIRTRNLCPTLRLITSILTQVHPLR